MVSERALTTADIILYDWNRFAWDDPDWLRVAWHQLGGAALYAQGDDRHYLHSLSEVTREQSSFIARCKRLAA